MEVHRDGKKLTLTPISMKLLIALMKASPNVISRRDLERAVWGDVVPDSDALRSHLYNLRKVIDKPFDKPLLHTVAGMGYRLVELDDG
jgi:DNA-binding winged helix-turn-helix (wHTH) protein